MLEVTLVSPSSIVSKEKASSVHLPGACGYLDIGAGHTDFLTELKSGIVTIKTTKDGQKKSFFVAGGYAQIKENNVTLLADVAESHQEIDAERAQSSENRAQERLSKTTDGSIQIERALQSLERAKERQKFVQTTQKK